METPLLIRMLNMDEQMQNSDKDGASEKWHY